MKLIGWVVGTVGFGLAVWKIPGHSADAVADWLVARAVVEGGDPHGVLVDMAADQGFGMPEYPFRHPRLPGAILLIMPYALVPFGWVRYMGTAVALAPLVATWFLVKPLKVAILLIVPASWALIEGSHSSVVTLLVAVAFLRGSGTALGVATALRAWPWYLGLVFVAVGRWRAAVVSGLVFVVLNLAGLLLPGVSVEGTVKTMAASYELFAGGGYSPPLFLSFPLAGGFLLLVRRHREVARFGILPALALSPVIWHHYLTALAVPLGRFSDPVEGVGSATRQDDGDLTNPR